MTTTQKNDAAALMYDSSRKVFSPASVAVVVFLFALLCFLPLPAGTPIASTEGHRSMTAHLMVQSGEWIVPRLFGRVYLAKPPLHYWIIATFEKLSGRATPFVWRLPSAIEGSLTAAILSLFAGRWFGRLAQWIAGISFVAIVALWGENRGADIDVSNTLTANLAALCILELHFGTTRNRARWVLGAGLATGASLLVKGPAGMTIILGALIWSAVDAIKQRRASSIAKPGFWLPLLIGAAIFMSWVMACRWYIHSHGMPTDLTGVQEGTQDLHPHDWSWRRAMEWIFLPVTMFLYSLPVSIAMPLTLVRELRSDDPRRARLTVALACSILVAWLICFISGMHLPRYAYPTLPLLCPLAGAVASQAYVSGPHFRGVLRAILFWSLIGFGIASVALCAMLWKYPPLRPMLCATGLLSIFVAGISSVLVLNRPNSWRPLWGVPALLLLLSTGMAGLAHFERLRRTSLKPAQQIRQWVLQEPGTIPELVTCAMVLDQPELFYYSDLPTRATNGDKLDWRPLKSGTWAVLEAPELEAWRAQIPDRLRKVIPFIANKNQGYLVLYAEP